MKNNTPINVAIPNVAKQKMAAILAVSQAIENVSKALISVQVDVTVSNNTINECDIGLNISTEDIFSKED